MIGTMPNKRLTYNHPASQKTVPVNDKLEYWMNNIKMRPDAVTAEENNIFWNSLPVSILITVLTLKELAKKNMKKNGTYIGISSIVIGLNVLIQINNNL